MKIVSENYADSFGAPGLSADTFLAAVIGDHLRRSLGDAGDLPDHLLLLARTLDGNEDEHGGRG
jgi:hypothetical protein